VANALNGGYHLAYAVAAGLAFVALVIAVVITGPVRGKRAARRATVPVRRSEPACSEA
jgi:hypothetical protein